MIIPSELQFTAESDEISRTGTADNDINAIVSMEWFKVIERTTTQLTLTRSTSLQTYLMV